VWLRPLAEACGRQPTDAQVGNTMIDLTPVQTEIASICKTIGIKRLELIGSAARDDFCSDSSDIDVLIEFDGAHDLFHRYFACKRQLEELFKRKVDVVQVGAVKNPYMKQSIERDRVVVYAA
jgi:predicted nucleotidyltransferase